MLFVFKFNKMTKLIRVYFRKGSHALYDSFITSPPEGVEYILSNLTLDRNDKSFKTKFKRWLWKEYTTYFPAVLKLNPENVDLIHSASGILINTTKKWVVDTENVYGFVNHSHHRLQKHKKSIQQILEADNCKKIMPHCEAAKRSIENFFQSEKINKKLAVLYPTMEVEKLTGGIKLEKKFDDFTFIFVGNRFLEKGGREALHAFDLIRDKINAKLIMISNVPEEYAKKYEKDENVRIIPANLKRAEVLEFMSKSHVFIFPSYKESFGIVYMEAMALGLPIITADVCAARELCEDTGIIIDSPIKWHDENDLLKYKLWTDFVSEIERSSWPEFEEKLSKAMVELYNNSQLREKFSKNGKIKVEQGILSVNHRNNVLKEAYTQAIK